MIQFSTLSEAYPNYKKKKDNIEKSNQSYNNDTKIINDSIEQPVSFNKINDIENNIKPFNDNNNLYNPIINNNIIDKPIINTNNYMKPFNDIKPINNDDIDEYLVYNNNQKPIIENKKEDIINKLNIIKNKFKSNITTTTNNIEIKNTTINNTNDILYNLLILFIIGLIIILLCEQITKIVVCKTIEKYNIDI